METYTQLLTNIQEHEIAGSITNCQDLTSSLMVNNLTDEDWPWPLWIIYLNGFTVHSTFVSPPKEHLILVVNDQPLNPQMS